MGGVDKVGSVDMVEGALEGAGDGRYTLEPDEDEAIMLYKRALLVWATAVIAPSQALIGFVFGKHDDVSGRPIGLDTLASDSLGMLGIVAIEAQPRIIR